MFAPGRWCFSRSEYLDQTVLVYLGRVVEVEGVCHGVQLVPHPDSDNENDDDDKDDNDRHSTCPA